LVVVGDPPMNGKHHEDTDPHLESRVRQKMGKLLVKLKGSNDKKAGRRGTWGHQTDRRPSIWGKCWAS